MLYWTKGFLFFLYAMFSFFIGWGVEEKNKKILLGFYVNFYPLKK